MHGMLDNRCAITVDPQYCLLHRICHNPTTTWWPARDLNSQRNSSNVITVRSNRMYLNEYTSPYKRLEPNSLLLVGPGNPCLPPATCFSSTKHVHTAAGSGGSQQRQRVVHATARGNGCHEVADVRPRLLPLVIEYVHLHTDCRNVGIVKAGDSEGKASCHDVCQQYYRSLYRCAQSCNPTARRTLV
jgi:hypothetical protein